MGRSLMIVDDSVTMRKIVMRTVRMSGLMFDRVEEAGNGLEALTQLEKAPVDVMLCDVNMPEMDGRELVQKVRASDTFKDMKIVMVSTESASDFIEELMTTGADAYVVKPFTSDRIQDTLAPLIN